VSGQLTLLPTTAPRLRRERISLDLIDGFANAAPSVKLRALIRDLGLWQPIVVVPSRSGRFRIVEGRRRCKAIAQLAEASEWPATPRVEALVVAGSQAARRGARRPDASAAREPQPITGQRASPREPSVVFAASVDQCGSASTKLSSGSAKTLRRQAHRAGSPAGPNRVCGSATGVSRLRRSRHRRGPRIARQQSRARAVGPASRPRSSLLLVQRDTWCGCAAARRASRLPTTTRRRSLRRPAARRPCGCSRSGTRTDPVRSA
jgi:ParB-like nuclease domain